jgi:hypothetical protein
MHTLRTSLVRSGSPLAGTASAVPSRVAGPRARKTVKIVLCSALAAALVVPALALQGQGLGEVVAVRELELRAGVEPAQFESFVTGTYNPGWQAAVPGLRAYIAKGDRGVHKGAYALVLIFDSQKTRDAIFPKEGGGASERFAPVLQKAFALNKELEKFLEPASLSVYTDYVALR